MFNKNEEAINELGEILKYKDNMDGGSISLMDLYKVMYTHKDYQKEINSQVESHINKKLNINIYTKICYLKDSDMLKISFYTDKNRQNIYGDSYFKRNESEIYETNIEGKKLYIPSTLGYILTRYKGFLNIFKEIEKNSIKWSENILSSNINLETLNSNVAVKVYKEKICVLGSEYSLELYFAPDLKCIINSNSHKIKTILKEAHYMIYKNLMIRIDDCPCIYQRDLMQMRYQELTKCYNELSDMLRKRAKKSKR